MYRALIIDDEKPVRQAIRALGHWVELGVDQLYEAMEGEAGLAILRANRPEIVIVDMKMPQMDGPAFLAVASREFPEMKYIVISGFDDYGYTRPAIQAKVVDYLLKPVIEAELNETLARAVADLTRIQSGEGAPQRQGEGRAEKRPLYEIKAYIDCNYFQEITLSLFAARYFLNKEYLTKLFKDEFGYNIYEYLLKVRMEKACQLLGDPNAKIGGISEALGYHDPNYFSKAFKTYYGITPSEFRENEVKSPLF